MKAKPAHSEACLRCGTCCRKGGPALHLEDQTLVEDGKIALKDLFTIRRGELAYDNVTGGIRPVETDIIKIASHPTSEPACRFYDAVRTACGIYNDRPVECRTLQCRHPERLAAMYRNGRLTRRHLLEGIPGLWDIIQDHQARCDYSRIAELAEVILNGRGKDGAQKGLMDLIRYDQSLREVTMERTGYPSGMLDFLLGRTLVQTIRQFRLRLAPTDGGAGLEPFI